MSDERDPRAAISEAIQEFVSDDGLVLSWALSVEIAKHEGGKKLRHHVGAGQDGEEDPEPWTLVGMLRAASQYADDYLNDSRMEWVEDDEEGESE